MDIGKLKRLGTVGCFYETIDFNGYRGWLTDSSTNIVHKIEEVRNDSIPLIKGDSVYFFLRGKVAFNVHNQ